MSIRPNFAVLEDPNSPFAGLPWHRVLEGDAAAAKNAGAALIAKDPSNNLDYLNTDAQGRLLTVANQEDVVDLEDEGDNAGSGSFVDLLTIVIQQSMDYKNFEFSVSCFRDATFEIVGIADVGVSDVETIIATIKVGSGSYTEIGKLTQRYASSGTGVQHIVVRAINLNVTSQLEASLSVQEVQ